LNTSERLRVAFKGLNDGLHEFRFSKSDSFFESLDYSEFSKGNIEVFVELEKKPQYLALNINISGQVLVTCDRCLDLFFLPFEYSGTLIAKFSFDELKKEDEEFLFISPNDYEVDITHYVYESVCLSLPLKRIHPEDKRRISTCNKKMIKELERINRQPFQEGIDPRWDNLRKFNNN
jgi:uncharacterized protein